MTTKQARAFANDINGPMTPEQAREFIGMLELGKSKIRLERGETTVIGIVVGLQSGSHIGIERLGIIGFPLAGEFAWTVRGVK